MSTEIRVPTLGESVTEATIGQWFKKIGDTVNADEPIVELETDKVTIEVPAPAAGVLEAIAAQPGETVDVGALLGAIGGAGAAVAAPKAEAKSEAPANNAAGPEEIKPEPAAQPGTATDRAPAPSAQKLINENGLAAGNISGSGKHGQVLKEDVLSAINKPAAAAAPAPVILIAKALSGSSSARSTAVYAAALMTTDGSAAAMAAPRPCGAKRSTSGRARQMTSKPAAGRHCCRAVATWPVRTTTT